MKVQRPILISSILIMLFLLMIPALAMAQEESVKGTPERRYVVSTNPILDMFTWYNGELEVKVACASTLGSSGSFISLEDGDETFLSANLFYRYYPQGQALKGFFFGVRGGVFRVEDKAEEEDEDDTGTFYGAGIDIGYSWLMGPNPRFALSLGIGAVRLFGGDLEDVALTLPTIRLVNIGIAF
jgi:hypothetical protein